tara:strand:+ start:615 stop:974 length:360 start_codon:yes stop_codon:yes gene_type:complete
MPSARNAVWRPLSGGRRGRGLSQSVIAVRNLKVGECKRIKHDDLKCGKVSTKNGETTSSCCSLRNEINKLRRGGWDLEYYHEQQGVLVVRRLHPYISHEPYTEACNSVWEEDKVSSSAK